MDYQKVYNRIINHAVSRGIVDGLFEIHHIVPKSFREMKNPNVDYNLVPLTPREHFICHMLLARIWRSSKRKGSQMGKAFQLMTGCGKYTSKDYSWLKLNKSILPETREKIANAHLGKKHSAETKEKMSKAKLGKILSEETRARMSISFAGRNNRNGMVTSEATKQKMREAQLGKPKKPQSEEAKQKISASTKGKPKSKKPCPCCGEMIVATRWFSRHVEKCSDYRTAS